MVFLLLTKIFASPHEQIYSLPAGWRHVGCPPDDNTLRLQVSLVQQNITLLRTLLDQISDPDSPCYGRYLDRDEVDRLFRPSDEAKREVHSWIRRAGIPRRDIQAVGHTINLSIRVNQANKLLNTTFLTYDNGHGQRVRTMRYYIPDSLRRYIHLVSPTIYFGGPNLDHTPPPSIDRRSTWAAKAHESCQASWTPSCLKSIYNIGDYRADPRSGSRLAWSAFWNDSASYSDVKRYEGLYKLPSSNFTVELVNGAVDNQDPSKADSHYVDLDAFNIIALTDGQLPVTQYSVAGLAPYIPNADGPSPSYNGNEPYLDLYQYMLTKTNAELPQIITNSYSEDEQVVPRRYAERVCNAVGMLGLRGITVIQTMAGAGPGTACLSNDGKNESQFTPQFPGSCPYVTAVGEVNQTNPLVAWNISSGGFSFYFDRPRYQDEAVSTYFDKHISPETLAYYRPFINPQGRASPDLSLQGFKPDQQVCGLLSSLNSQLTALCSLLRMVEC